MRVVLAVALACLALSACAPRSPNMAGNWCTRGGVEFGSASYDDCFRTEMEGRATLSDRGGPLRGDVAPSIGDAGSRF